MPKKSSPNPPDKRMSNVKETLLEINLAALQHNFNYLKSKLSRTTRFMAVVKAYAYGSDANAVALHLEQLGADYFAVAYASEGVILRTAGIRSPILVLHPQPGNFSTLIKHCLEPNLYNAKVLNTFIDVAKASNQKEYPVHIKFNTGLNRLGFWENDVDYVVDRITQAPSVKIKSLFSHLAASEDLNENEFSLTQIQSFKNIANECIHKLGYTPMLHLCNTSGILNYPEAHLDMVRSGIGLYGFANSADEDQQLRPIAALKSVISQIHMIEPHESVGYNRAFKATNYMKTATIPIGHADGISRQFGNGKGYVIINKKKAFIIGNVCMDMLMVDITNIDCYEGDEVIIFDESYSASSLAEICGTISYELLTAISQRVKRKIVD